MPLLVLHDFDKSGFSIVGTLRRDTRRFRFSSGHAARVIDLGLRLEDIDGLETEEVYVADRHKAAANLRENGATAEEIEFLLEKRVELNAFASDQLIDWIEWKVQEHGVAKVVPDGDVLADAYRRMRRQALVQDRIDEVLADLGDTTGATAPKRLAAQIARHLKANPARSWDAVLRKIVEADHKRSKT